MASYKRIFRLFLGTNRDVKRDVEEEIRSHLELRSAALERQGYTAEAARAEAERRFGDVAAARRRLEAEARVRVGRQRRRDWLASVAADVRLAWRRARDAPAQTAIALLTFALGIGLTTAGFTVVDRVLIRALPFPDPDRLVALQTQNRDREGIPYLSSQIWLDWRDETQTLAGSAIYSARPEDWGYTDGQEAFYVTGRLVTPSFFDVLGVRMVAGRGFGTSDLDQASVVVAEGFWRRVLGSASLPVDVDLGGRLRTVVGVVPAGLEYPLGTEAYRVFQPTPRGGESYNWLNFFGIGRLAEGASLAQAGAELGTIARGALEQNPEAQYLYGAAPLPLHDLVVGDARRSLLLLMGAVVLLLLIACANLAGLGVARASTRGREVALRLSLGAGRLRLIRQLLTEHLVLAIAGGAVGAALAVLATRGLARAAASQLPRATEIAVDVRVLTFALLLSIAAGVLAGLLPALWSSAAPLRGALVGGRDEVRGGRNLPGAVMVAVEIALALVLLTGGSLLTRSFVGLLGRDLGFQVAGVVTADAVIGGRLEEEQWPEFWRRLETRLEENPVVAAVGITNAPPTGDGGTGFIQVEGLEEGRAGAGYRVASDGVFEALGMEVVAGRGFTPQDREGTERVTVVNQQMAERYWPGESPVGKRVKAYSMEGTGGTAETAPWLTVIGVVSDVRQNGPEEEAPTQMYVSIRQVPIAWHLSQMTAVVRGEPGVSEGSLIRSTRDTFRGLDPRQAVEVSTMRDRLSGILSQRRLTLSILTGFAALSLLLAGIGVYGLLSFAVSQSRREMGIRAVLGARRSEILGLVMRRAFRIVAAGAIGGLLLSYWLTRAMQSLLVDTPPRDPVSFAIALGVLVIAAAGAALIPALRATRADPMEALRA